MWIPFRTELENQIRFIEMEEWWKYGFSTKEAYEDAIVEALPRVGARINERDRKRRNEIREQKEHEYEYLWDKKEELEEKYRYCSDMYEQSAKESEKAYFEDLMEHLKDQIQDIEEQMSVEEPNWSDTSDDIEYLEKTVNRK